MTSEPPSDSPAPYVASRRSVNGFAVSGRNPGRLRVLPYAVPARSTSRPNRGNWPGMIGVASVFALMVLSAVAYAVAN